MGAALKENLAPWDRMVGWVFVAGGAILTVVGMARVTGAASVADQLSFLMSAGIGGLACVCLGASLVVSAAWNDERERLDAVEQAVRDGLDRDRGSGFTGHDEADRGGGGERVGSGRGDRESAATGALRIGTESLSSGGVETASLEVNLPLRWALAAERDRVVAWAVILAAIVMLLVGSRRVAESSLDAERVAYVISAGLGSLALTVTGAAQLLLADLRDGAYKISRLERAVGGCPLPDPRSLLARWAGSWARGHGGEEPVQPARRGGGRLRSARFGFARARFRFWLWPSALGLVLLIGGWREASTTTVVDEAATGMRLAGVGLAVWAATFAMLIRHRRRAVIVAKGTVMEALVACAGGPTGGHARGSVSAPQAWTAPGSRLSHRRECPALRFAGGDAFVAPEGPDALPPCLLCHREE